jgi:hypothetical protein
MSREIKFRAWDDFNKEMIPYLSIDNQGWIFSSATNSPFVMQFTGLLDKNGKEIYEGDVLKAAKTGKFYPVEWDGRDAHFHAQEGQFILMSYNWQYAEVIGNIYENPGLIAP